MTQTTPDVFREFFHHVSPIRMRDPLATLLGAFHDDNDIMEYRFSDVVKMAGHGCPTVSMAFLATKQAIAALYPDGIGVRGGMTVLIHGERDDGVYGVMSQVISYITGACPESGFKGLGGLFRRNNLLQFGVKQNDNEIRFDFIHEDTKKLAIVKLFPGSLPALPPESMRRMSELLSKNVWDAANDRERIEFRNLWMERVELILCDELHRESWLMIEAQEK